MIKKACGRLAAWLLPLGGLAGCGMPEATAPAPPPELSAEPAPTLLGGLQQPPAASGPAAPARRPGWGTMAPIPNPTELAAAPPYRLIGPTTPEASTALASASPSRAPAARRIVEAKPRRPGLKPRVRHLIVPIRNRG